MNDGGVQDRSPVRTQDRTVTRCRIVDAATALFWRDGYHAVSTDAICRAAKISKSSLYHAFPSKEEVAAAALERVWSANWADINAIYDAAGGGEAAKFRSHLDWFAASQRRLRDEHGVVLGTFDMALGVAVPERMRQAMRAHQHTHAERLRRSVGEALGARASEQADWLADIVMHAISGAMIRSRLADDLAPLEALPDAVLKLIATARSSAAG